MLVLVHVARNYPFTHVVVIAGTHTHTHTSTYILPHLVQVQQRERIHVV